MATSDIPPKSNPAGRLWHLVMDGRRIANDSIPMALSKLFGCRTDEYAMLLRGLLNYVDLTDEVERLMKEVPRINPAKHLTWTPKVRAAYQNMGLSGHPFQIVLQPFDDPALSLISICSDHLESIMSEPIADEAGVRRLLDEAIRLQAEIAKSEIELPLREYLLKHLRLVIEALFDYRTKGFESLWDGLAAVRGHIDLSGLRIGRGEAAIAKSPLWVKLAVIVSGLCALVDNAQRVEYVLEKGQRVQKLLALPGESATTVDVPERSPN